MGEILSNNTYTLFATDTLKPLASRDLTDLL